MQGLFRRDSEENEKISAGSQGVLTLTTVLGFIGSAVICWVVLRLITPVLSEAWGINWLYKPEIKAVITAVVALAMSFVLTRIEGTIWGRYYVIVGYLLSFALIVWIVLRLLHFA